MRRVTFSRNYTLSLSRTCQCYCKYCAFATHRRTSTRPTRSSAPRRGERRNAKELLVLTGERPEVNPEVAAKLAEWGHDDFTSYVVWACERALERGILPHTNIGVLERDDLARLREVTASQGLMLESVSERLMETVHAGSPTKHPAQRLATIEAAGELKIPFTSGILVGIGETEEEQVESLEALAELHGRIRPHPGGDPPELRPASAVLRAERSPTSRMRRRASGGGSDGGAPPLRAPQRTLQAGPAVSAAPRVPSRGIPAAPSGIAPPWASPVSVDDIKRLIRECKRLMPDVGIQVPPNLSDAWAELVEAGATDLGGLSANGDHISPEHAFPSPHEVRKGLAPKGYALTERLCVYPQYMDSEWMEQGVLDVIKLKYWSFIPRRGSGRRSEEPIDAGLAPRAIAKGREGWS